MDPVLPPAARRPHRRNLGERPQRRPGLLEQAGGHPGDVSSQAGRQPLRVPISAPATWDSCTSTGANAGAVRSATPTRLRRRGFLLSQWGLPGARSRSNGSGTAAGGGGAPSVALSGESWPPLRGRATLRAPRPSRLQACPDGVGGGVHDDGARRAVRVLAVVGAVDAGVEEVPVAVVLDEQLPA